ncbi:MAG: nuclear transport factor 2 family protein [Deltaproteobacteria bacterium]|jgi:ketosteroid isomerase-like protein|nr:nuclear transport factor 2 family protein [Deltaproteobacteria bacterium]
MTSEESRKTVLEFLAAREKGDVDAITRLTTEDLRWDPPGPDFEAVEGRDEVLAFMNQAGAEFFDVATMDVDIHKIIADGDTVAIVQSMRCKTAKGADYSNLYCWVYTCADGRVSRMQEFTDTKRFDEIVNA